MIFALEEREETTLAEDVGGYALSARRHEGPGAAAGRATSSTTPSPKAQGRGQGRSRPRASMVDRVPAEEWAQIFDEVWRRYRDFFYVENMHGYDWEALGEQYRPLLAHVGPPLGPELRDRRDDRRAQRRPRLHRGRRLRDPRRGRRSRCPGPRFELDAAAGPLPHRARSSAGRTRRSATARR